MFSASLPSNGGFKTGIGKTQKSYPKKVAHQQYEYHSLSNNEHNCRMEADTLKQCNQKASNNTDNKELE